GIRDFHVTGVQTCALPIFVAIHKLTDLAKGTTLNVGIVRGGEAVNMVAPSAEAEIDLRYVEPPERAKTMAAIEEIVATSYVPGRSEERRVGKDGRRRGRGE